MSEQKETPRRGFIATILGTTAALGLASVISPFKAQAAAFKATPANETEALFKNLRGKHKLVFDASAFRSGAALAWSHSFLETNNETGTADKDLNAVVVLRSVAIGMSLSDAMWEKYKLGEMYKVDDPDTKAPALKNIFIVPDKDDPGMTIAELQQRGVLFCVCSLALEGNSEHIAEKLSLKKEDVHNDLITNVLPGIHKVPSGVWALGRAQENGCGYCVAG